LKLTELARVAPSGPGATVAREETWFGNRETQGRRVSEEHGAARR